MTLSIPIRCHIRLHQNPSGLPTSFQTCNLTTIAHILVNKGSPEPVQPSKYLVEVSLVAVVCLELVKVELYGLIYTFI